MERVVIVGAGLAGLESARALREQGYQGSLTLVGAEPYPPYDRPPLSKELLAGEVEDSTLEVDWAALDVELLLGRRATKLRPGVVDTDGGTLDFDGLVIATGARPVTLPGHGPQRTLRTVDEARSLRAALLPGTRVAVVGAGWIGAEVATVAARAGCRVTVVEGGPTPLAGNVGPEIGRHTERWYADAGIELRVNTPVQAVTEGGLALAGGELLPADEVLTAVGVRPDIDWLEGSGLDLDGAVLVDEHLRTNLAGVCAVGDCSAWWSRRFSRRLRVEHWDNALRAPAVAADTLLRGDSRDRPEALHDPVPYFWSAQHGRMLQFVGERTDSGELVWRGDPDGERWAACWITGGVLDAMLTVDLPRDLSQARRLIAAAAQVDPAVLADPSVPVKQARLTS